MSQTLPIHNRTPIHFDSINVSAGVNSDDCHHLALGCWLTDERVVESRLPGRTGVPAMISKEHNIMYRLTSSGATETIIRTPGE
jgi:hypothetical protein